ncbi:O-antigen polysaccharide polymerase Wzy family protein [Ruminococcus sp. OA3]|uniref:O-antigen polysaccharide polymerase Wzy family protein n=1 Tax=Ruminococcus sp. OA3 TaxID=2914164 RepID=UPI001F06A5C3|nr:O-antigen polysaccharide polymerase Wzy family protein [Ruminococcus sp. OA3]
MNIKSLYGLLAIAVMLIAGLLTNVEGWFLLVLSAWLFLLFYAYHHIKDRSMLFVFLIAFFVFLLGRDFLQQFIDYKTESFPEDVQAHAYISYFVTLLTLGLGYHIFTKYGKKRRKRNVDYVNNTEKVALIKKISLYVYYFSWVFAVVSEIAVGSFVAARGVTDYYTDFSEYLTGNTILYVISKIELIMPVAWNIYLATRPNKKQIKCPLIFYVVYLVISLGSGQRSTAMLGILFLFVYFVYRQGLNPDESWITKKMVITGVIAVPLLAVFASGYSIWREGGEISGIRFMDGFINFFYDQGVTGNVMKRAYMYSDKIPSDQTYILEFLHSGIFARLFGIKVYHGNTVEHALYGGSFTHALGYTVMGDAYLSGRGTGSCYIAELYQDFGYTGIILGNVLYSLLIARIANRNKDERVLSTAIRFIIITQLLWAIRGSYTGFITQLFAPTTLVTIIFVFVSAQLLLNKKLKGLTPGA